MVKYCKKNWKKQLTLKALVRAIAAKLGLTMSLEEKEAKTAVATITIIAMRSNIPPVHLIDVSNRKDAMLLQSCSLLNLWQRKKVLFIFRCSKSNILSSKA